MYHARCACQELFVIYFVSGKRSVSTQTRLTIFCIEVFGALFWSGLFKCHANGTRPRQCKRSQEGDRASARARRGYSLTFSNSLTVPFSAAELVGSRGDQQLAQHGPARDPDRLL